MDGIRAVAILLVFLFHCGKLRGGWVGVNVFFTLSGYLITSILVKEHESNGTIRLSRFFTSRACRLLPAAVTLICAALALSFFFHDDLRDTELDAGAAFLYVLNYRYAFFTPSTHTGIGHLWSLSVEEQFYLVWPFVIIASLSLLGRKGPLICAIVGTIAVIGWRAFLVADGTPSPYYRIYFAFDTRIDELLIGCALALSGSRPVRGFSRTILWCWPALAAVFAVVILKLDALHKWEAVSSYPFLDAGAALLIIVATSDAPSIVTKILTITPLVALGKLSYGFYLWHYLIISELNKHGLGGSKAMLAAFGLTLAASIGSYHLIERPALRLKARLWPSP